MTVFSFDAFISYRHKEPDLSWARDVLVPGLEKNNVKVIIDYRDFHLGAHLISEMNRAVEKSRYTIAVLTPAYLDSNFTDLENIMAEQLGLEKGQRRLIVVLREKCSSRLSLRSKLWLDMTDDSVFNQNIVKLVDSLRQPPSI